MTNQQTSFTGTEPPPPKLTIDAEALKKFLVQFLDGIDNDLIIEKFKGGQSNPTYKLTSGHKSYVLRRKPPGKLIPGAHAIDREFKVISALFDQGIPLPKPYLYCDSTDVIGTEFYIVDFVDGRVFWDPTLPGIAKEERAAIYDDANRWLARIHTTDIDAVGLGDFGRGENYAARNLERWSKQYRASELEHIPDMHWLMQALTDELPSKSDVRLLHGDYGLYNLIFHREEPRVVAILDWEMATLGDPLVDLAHCLRPWWLQPDEDADVPTLVGRGDLDGIPDMDTFVAKYLERVGIEVWPHKRFYLAYAQFRYAAMVQGVLKRFADGTAANSKTSHTQERVIQAARNARRILEQ